MKFNEENYAKFAFFETLLTLEDKLAFIRSLTDWNKQLWSTFVFKHFFTYDRSYYIENLVAVDAFSVCTAEEAKYRFPFILVESPLKSLVEGAGVVTFYSMLMNFIFLSTKALNSGR